MNDSRKKQLHSFVNNVKEFMQKKDINVPFFIAGGCVFSTITSTNTYDDIDVWFYTNEDLEKFRKEFDASSVHTSQNSLNFIKQSVDTDLFDASSVALDPLWNHETKLQCIIRNTGTPNDIMNEFDLNCSRCCITSDYEFITGTDFDVLIKINVESITLDTIRRYDKYTTSKGARSNLPELYKIIDKLLSDVFKEYPAYYSEQSLIGIDILNTAGNKYVTSDIILKRIQYIQYIHEGIINKYTMPEQIEIFKELTCAQRYDIISPSPELILARYLKSEEGSSYYLTPERMKILENKYPEYLI